MVRQHRGPYGAVVDDGAVLIDDAAAWIDARVPHPLGAAEVHVPAALELAGGVEDRESRIGGVAHPELSVWREHDSFGIAHLAWARSDATEHSDECATGAE